MRRPSLTVSPRALPPRHLHLEGLPGLQWQPLACVLGPAPGISNLHVTGCAMDASAAPVLSLLRGLRDLELEGPPEVIRAAGKCWWVAPEAVGVWGGDGCLVLGRWGCLSALPACLSALPACASHTGSHSLEDPLSL